MVDVARLAGVSHQTVSRVLNNHPNVRQETARRVRAAIAELGYRPNRAARALVTGRSQLLGVVALNTSLYGPASLLTAFEGAAAAAGFAVSVGNVVNLDRASISAVVERHLDQRVAGIVVIAPVASAADALDHLSTDVPLVTIDGDPERNRAGRHGQPGARRAPGHPVPARARPLHGLARLRPSRSGSTPRAACGAGSRPCATRVPRCRRCSPPTGRPLPATGWAACSRAIPEVTAVFAANDHLAFGILRALPSTGAACPRTSASSASTTCPRRATSSRRSPPCAPISTPSPGMRWSCCSPQIEAGMPSKRR